MYCRRLIQCALVSCFPFLSLGSVYGASSLTFDSGGNLNSFVINDVDFLDDPATFTLKTYDGRDIVETLLTVQQSGNQLTVSDPGGTATFTFRIDIYDRHLSLHLTDVQGLDGDGRHQGLKFVTGTSRNVTLEDLDAIASVKFTDSSNTVQIFWKNLREINYKGMRGSVVIHDGVETGAERDQTLAEIWTTEDVPRPAGQTSWTEADVMAWVADYAVRLNELSTINIEASSEVELYELTNELLPSNFTRVYLHCATWRGEYWPDYNPIDHVNLNVFPNGKDDLKAYIDYLRTHGVGLAAHNVSLGIGLNDPNYIIGGVDRRFYSWGNGVLEKSITETDELIKFRPDSDLVVPTQYKKEYMRIGEEIIKIGRFTRTEQDVWILEDCTRGIGGTSPTSHASVIDCSGLYMPYDRNYIPADDLDDANSLLDEMAKRYADLINYVGLDHMHFDGLEIHEIEPWYARNVLDRVYSYIDRPVTSSAVGRRVHANREGAFSQVKARGYHGVSVPLRIQTSPAGLLAISWLETHFAAQEPLNLNATRVTMRAEKNADGITSEALDTSGLVDSVLELFSYWQEILPLLAEEDRDYVKARMSRISGGNRYQGEDVFVLEKNNLDQYVFTPHHVMGRTSGEDPLWKVKQEHGAQARKQVIQAGDSLSLTNPKAAQNIDFLIRVADDTNVLVNPSISINSGAGSLQMTGTVAYTEYLEYDGGSTARVYDMNWNLLRTLPASASNFNAANGTVNVQLNDGNGVLVAIETQFIVQGDVYTLKTNDNL